MARWVVAVVLVVVALVVATRSMSGTVRAAADFEFGRRFMWFVKLWKLWRVLLAGGFVAVAALLVMHPGSRGTGTGAVAHSSGGTAASSPHAAADGAASGGVPGWVFLLLLLAGAAAVLASVARARARRRTDRELAFFVAETGDWGWQPATRREQIETEDEPWEQAGTGPTERVDTEEHDAQYDSSGDDGSGGLDAGDVEVEDLVGPGAGASVHHLAHRRRGAHRRL